MNPDSVLIDNKKNTNPPVTKKSLARLIACQILYQCEFYNFEKPVEKFLDESIKYCLGSNVYIKNYKRKIDLILLFELSNGALNHFKEADEVVKKFLKENWTLEKLPEVIRAIFRVCFYELLKIEKTPINVIINEYVDIVACFFDDKKVTFANAIIEKMAHQIRKQ